MLRYRVAYDSERGHFVLPSLAGIVPPEQTFASRTAAQKIAQTKNSLTGKLTSTAARPHADLPFEPTVMRRASA